MPSLPVATVVLASPGGWWIALILGGLVNLAGGVLLERDWDRRYALRATSWQVNQFIRTTTVESIDARGVHQKVDLRSCKFDM